MLAGLLLRRLFSHNQENFTGGQPIIPVVTVIEEAQSVLGRNLDDTSPYVEWVKEGRKYELGAMLITQQPGSMASELLSQADNWFCFHLLSEGDAGTLGRFNSHFSEDILAHLIGEPIPGNCFIWSAPHQPFVLPVRVRSFEDAYKREVKKDSAQPRVEGTRSQEVLKTVSESLDRLKNGLLDELKQSKVKKIKFVRVPGAISGNEGIGVASGQLYYVIKDLKMPVDTQPEDELKKVLLNLIFGEGVVHVAQFNDKDYFCAAMADWERVLGRRPNVQ
jgi:hypothetical protein